MRQALYNKLALRRISTIKTPHATLSLGTDSLAQHSVSGRHIALTLTAVPALYLAPGLELVSSGASLLLLWATGLSITLGYHRLFSHLSFKASSPVRLFTLLFGAAAFENSALGWAADHRSHHKFVDHDKDPYDISKGFFHAHIGWILFRLQPETSLDGVKDLQRDRLVMWQHRTNYRHLW